MQISPHQGQRYPREAGPAAHVDNRIALRYQFSDDRAVEDVPIPEPVDFTGTNEAALDPGARQDVREGTQARLDLWIGEPVRGAQSDLRQDG